ncbi:hypothetical protein D3C71_1181110 [compost metagenome]
MTSKTETAKQLIVLATDGAIRVNERLAALEQADVLRKELKVGWTKVGSMDAKEVEEMRTDLKWACDAFEVRRLEAGTFEEFLALPALQDEEFEASEEELAEQALRPKAPTAEEIEALPSDLRADVLAGLVPFEAAVAAVQADHQNDFVPPTVVSEPEADKPEPEASEAPQKLTAAERGAIGVMARDLLQTSMSYEDIAHAIRERYPHAKTTARSLASVAADMRRDGIPCPSRRKGK